MSLIIIVWVFISGWHNVPATGFNKEVVSFTSYIPGLVNVISGSNELALPDVKLQPGFEALGQLSGFEEVICQL